ncbi:MAG: DUF424 family protein [Nanoarchaeota archaeon]
MLVKIIKSHRDIVAICDTELLGKRFEEGNLQLDIKESFFSGKEMNEEEVMDVIIKMSQEDATFNIIGQESINTAIKVGLIKQEEVKTIQGVPFVLILL